jgi:hypothetical protein
MSPVKKIGAGITRTDLTMADGRTAFVTTTPKGQCCAAQKINVLPEAQPGIGELRKH